MANRIQQSNKMNTTEIGNRFENKVFNLFSEELANGRLPLSSDSCKIFKKKAYYSRDRQKNITVDISIEAYLPDQEVWSILIVIECKDYTHSVPVDYVEEFFSKLDQIAGKNIKGVVVSSNAFQEGALEYAKSKGIGLVRILNEVNLKWMLPRAATGYITYDQLEKSYTKIYNGLVKENYTSDNIDFYSIAGDSFTHSAGQFFELLLGKLIDQDTFCSIKTNYRKRGNNVSHVAPEEIEEITEGILKRLSYKDVEVPIKEYCNYFSKTQGLKISYGYDLGYDTIGFEIFGKIIFDPPTIFISRGAHHNIFSRKFTIAHELGHYILNHGKYLQSEYYSDEDFEREIADSVSIEEIRSIEWQANHFAASLLLPRKSFVNQFTELLSIEDIKDRGHGVLFVDKQECNLNTFYRVTNKLMGSFRVSRKVVEVRLMDLGLLKGLR